MNTIRESAARAADILAQADGLLLVTGAGMGCDSGLPAYRTQNGLWTGYKGLGNGQIHFESLSSQAFVDNPKQAWGFYGHLLLLFRRSQPHDGYNAALRIGNSLPGRVFAATTNIDGFLQRAGFPEERVRELHGSLMRLQCSAPCSKHTWPADSFAPIIDEQRALLSCDPPVCPLCGAPARPNVLKFGDRHWNGAFEAAQALRYPDWRRPLKSIAVIEAGAGTAIRAARNISESQAHSRLIRINPNPAECACPPDGAGLTIGAKDGLCLLAEELDKRGLLA